jgi:two-component sensor histidine kinase
MQPLRSNPPPSSHSHPVSQEFRHLARNLLTVISVNAEWLAEEIEDEEQRAALADMLDACVRLSKMVETKTSPAFEPSPSTRLICVK